MSKPKGIFLYSFIVFLFSLVVFHQSVFSPDTAQAALKTDKQSFTDLPLPAQAKISEVLGRDNTDYQVFKEKEGYRIENRMHRYEGEFKADGIKVKKGTQWFGLSLTGYGYGEPLKGVETATPVARGNRIEYSREGIKEWYVNGPLGLEQGFTLDAAPSGRKDGPLTLAVRMTGELMAGVDREGRGLTLRATGGKEVFRYSGLMAFDSTGKELRTWLEVNGERLLIRVDDTEAAYPVVIDPFIQTAKLTASDGAVYDHFGRSVAISGDTIVVSAPGDNSYQGSAYVFVKPGGGWADMTQTAKLTASDGADDDSFGEAVAISGDTIVVGAYRNNSGQGSAYVFVKPGGGWADMTQTAKLTASDGAAFESFGGSVAISGDTIVVGYYGNNIYQGSAYVFVKPGGGWANMTQTAKLTASDGAAFDFFGVSVAISGDTIVVGADEDNSEQGSAYVFVKPGGGWADMTQTAKLTASDGAAYDHFGRSVAISGDTIVVGADDDNSRVGSAYVLFMETMPLPTGPTDIYYLYVIDPILSSMASDAKPIGVGNIVRGTTIVGAGFPQFAAPVDIYIAVQIPGFTEIQLFTSTNSLVPLNMASPNAWKTATSGPIDEVIFTSLRSAIPLGLYDVYIVLVPSGTNPATFNFTTSPYYMWTFSVFN